MEIADIRLWMTILNWTTTGGLNFSLLAHHDSWKRSTSQVSACLTLTFIPFPLQGISVHGLTLGCSCLNKHITKICGSAFFYLSNIRHIRNYLSQTSTERLIHAFVSSCLDYCNRLLHDLPDFLLNKLQRVQNACAWLIFNERRLLWSYTSYQLDLELS